MWGMWMLCLAIVSPGTEDRPTEEASKLARRAVAEKVGSTEDDVVVEKIEAAEWPNSGLGCPAKGEVVQPSVTAGYRVSVRSGALSYVVHVGAGQARLCGDRTTGGSTGTFLAAGVKVGGLARKDLAARLGLDPKDVRLDSVKPTTWPDGNLGCAGPPAVEAVPTKGFILTLRAGEKEYTYHADTERALACSKD